MTKEGFDVDRVDMKEGTSEIVQEIRCDACRITVTDSDEIYLNGELLPPLPYPQVHPGFDIAKIGECIFVNGFVWDGGKWKLTLRSMFRYITNSIVKG